MVDKSVFVSNLLPNRCLYVFTRDTPMKLTTILSHYSFICKTLFFTSVLKLASFLKVSFIIGSYISFFSLTPILAPLAGAYNGLLGAALLLLFSSALKIISGASLSFAHLALMGIPSFCAGLVWTSQGRLVSLIIPIISAIAYLANPESSVIYALLWLIPLVIAVTNKKNIFLSALTSTMVAHAVGSVIWAYSVPMTQHAWLALTPLALVERIIFASAMTLVHLAMGKVLVLGIKLRTA